MKRFIFLIFTCSLFWQVNAQIEFAPIGAEWYYNILDSNELGGLPSESHRFARVVSERDTIINGYNCRVLIQSQRYMVAENQRFIIKQKSEKVYYYYQNQFHLFLDFGAEVNDTINFSFRGRMSFFDSSQNPAFWTIDTVFSVRAVVEDIATNIQNFRTFTTKILEEDRFNNCFPHPYIYTEKIGAHNRFMQNIMCESAPAVYNINRYLRCYSEADFSFVSDEWLTMSEFMGISLPCDYPLSLTDINLPKVESVNIYPNPFSDNIFVFTNNGGSIEIADVSGKIVYHSELLKGTNEIVTKHFPQGFFFVKIQDKNNSIQTFKIIKL
jgi:hypothetical protein